MHREGGKRTRSRPRDRQVVWIGSSLNALKGMPLNTYRAMYTAKVGDRIYVLHAFQKKSKSGTETPARDLELIRRRLLEAREYEKTHAQRSDAS